MFLPGLPSQVLVTQHQGDDAAWEHPEGDDEESSQKPEEETAASEYVFPSPSHPPHPFYSPEEDASSAGAVVALLEGNEPPNSGVEGTGPEPIRSNKSCSSVDGRIVPGSEKAREEAGYRQDDSFTVALREFVGEVVGSAQRALPNGSGGSGSGERLRSPFFKYVPTLEVLPSGWSGGQAGVVAVLEGHLSRARARFPGGYAARALQLACHILRQPTVCVRVKGNQGDSSAAASGGAATADDGRHEVVGVAGFVWEILRAKRR